MAGTCECCNEPLGSIKCGDFLTSWKPVSLLHRVNMCSVLYMCVSDLQAGYLTDRYSDERRNRAEGYALEKESDTPGSREHNQ